MPDHCTSLRQHNEQQRQPAATRSLPDHTGLSPLAKSLALDPAEVKRLCARSLHTPTLAPVVPIERAGRLALPEAAALYLRTPQAPCGLAKAIAADHGLDYAALLSEIVRQRDRSRFA